MYDKAGRVLRIETVINDPKEFFVHRPRLKNDGRKEVGWFEMSKGVANLYRYAQVSQRANDRYLEALRLSTTWVSARGNWTRDVCWYLFKGGDVAACSRFRRRSGPVSSRAAGEHAVRGFRNGEVAERLYGPRPKDPVERRRRSGRVSRKISLLRAHGLVAKYPALAALPGHAAGQRFMSTAIHVCAKLFAEEFGRQAY